MRLLELQFGFDKIFEIHIEMNRSGNLYFSDGNMIEFYDLKSAKDYFKNQIEYAFSNWKCEDAHIENYFDNIHISNEDDGLNVDENLKIKFLEFVDKVNFNNNNLVYNTLLEAVFPKHHEQFFELYNSYWSDHFYEKEHIVAEMFDFYKTEQLQTAVNEEMCSYDKLSNNEKALCLSGFMEMYACHRSRSIYIQKEKYGNVSLWLDDFIGENKANEIQSIIEKKHEHEEGILNTWIG